MLKLFFRVEHPGYYNLNINNNNNNNTKISCGPWSLLDLFSDNIEEVNYMASISTKHALPYYKEGRPFDSKINEIVMENNKDKTDSNNIKEEFIFGCSSKYLINKYFPLKFREILHKHGFHIGVYSSENVFSSEYQSVMDTSKPFSFVGAMNLI